MADLGAFFGNPNLQRQVARARALAEKRDVNTLADPRTYAAVQGLLGTAPDQMGFSVLHPDYQKIRETAEPAYALGLLAQAAPVLAPLTKNLPVGASIKNVGDDLLSYRGSHKAPSPEFGAPLHDLTGGSQMYPADVYSAKAAQFYGTGYPKADKEAFDLAKKIRGNPNAEVTMYRAVPKDEKITKINEGDWVTLSKDYAKVHGESVLGDDYKIISQKVKAKELWTNADSIHEFGYHPQKSAPRQEALDTAQRNAALPIEEGGLGLPKDNTPEMRAEAMGFDINTIRYHGSDKDISAFDPAKFGKNDQGWYGRGVTTDTDPEIASGYANYNEAENGQVVYPLLTRGKYMDWPEGQQPFASAKDSIQGTKDIQGLGYQGTRMTNDRDLYGNTPQIGTEQVTFNPANVRSRFAAFDPMRRNESDILAGVLPLGLLADEEQRKKLYELVPSLLGQ